MKATMNIIFTMIEERLSLISRPMKRNLIFSFQNMKKLSEIVLKYIRHLFILQMRKLKQKIMIALTVGREAEK